jgi:hypothetical protein
MLNDMPVNNVLDEEFKLTTEPVVMDNAVEYEWHEIQPDTLAASNPQAQNWRLQLKNLNAYVNPARAYLEVSCRMTTNLNADLVANTNASIQNHILSLFRRATLRVGGQIVETVNEAHVAKGLVQPLLHYSQDYASSSGTNEMFYLDDGDFAPLTPNSLKKYTFDAGAGTVVDTPTYNDGHAKRYARSNGKDFHAWVPLSALFGFCSVDRILTNNQFIVELEKSPEKHHVLSEAGNEKVAIKKISIWMPNILPKSVVDLSLKSAFADGVVSNYMFPQMQSYTFVQANAGIGNFRIVTSSEKVLYAFVVARAKDRTSTEPTCKTLDNINTLELRLNGRQYPLQPYVNLKADTEDKTRAYSDTLRYMNRNYDFSSGIQLSYDRWTKSSIYTFDFTAQPEANMGAPATLELRATTDVADVEWSVCVLSEKRAQIRYDGGSSVVLVN